MSLSTLNTSVGEPLKVTPGELVLTEGQVATFHIGQNGESLASQAVTNGVLATIPLDLPVGEYRTQIVVKTGSTVNSIVDGPRLIISPSLSES